VKNMKEKKLAEYKFLCSNAFWEKLFSKLIYI
jgi:hypothetical protein